VLASGLQVAASFLKPGQRLLSARGRSAETKELTVPEGVTPFAFKLAVLVDDKTASAAEITAGALQDHGRARLFGRRTYGKGLVQSVYPLKEGNGLALTTAFYYTPNGRSIQRPLRGVALSAATSGNVAGGIEPDEQVLPEAPTRFRAALEMSAAFPAFATEWLARHRNEVTPEFVVAPALIDEFQLWLSRRNIRPAISEWIAEQPFVRRRLRQEILNLSLGVQAGDEVELRADPVVLRAMAWLTAQ
jgi:carboxyl-terminal processing protease